MEFEHYNPNELVAIFDVLARVYKLELTPEARTKLQQHLVVVYARRSAEFGNARYVRNLLEKTVERQANRIVSIKPLTDPILCTLTADDVPEAAEVVLF